VAALSTDAELAAKLVETLLPLGTAARLADSFAHPVLRDADCGKRRGNHVAQARTSSRATQPGAIKENSSAAVAADEPVVVCIEFAFG
jgi:hypothetical protein